MVQDYHIIIVIELADGLARAIGTAVVDQDDLHRHPGVAKPTDDTTDGFTLIEHRHDDRQFELCGQCVDCKFPADAGT